MSSGFSAKQASVLAENGGPTTPPPFQSFSVIVSHHTAYSITPLLIAVLERTFIHNFFLKNHIQITIEHLNVKSISILRWRNQDNRETHPHFLQENSNQFKQWEIHTDTKLTELSQYMQYTVLCVESRLSFPVLPYSTIQYCIPIPHSPFLFGYLSH